MSKVISKLGKNLQICSGGARWVGKYKDSTPQELWETCPIGHWLLVWVAKIGLERELVVAATVDCVEPVLPLMPFDDGHAAMCVAKAKLWVSGKLRSSDLGPYARVANNAYDKYALIENPSLDVVRAKNISKAGAWVGYAVLAQEQKALAISVSIAGARASLAATEWDSLAKKEQFDREAADRVRARIPYSKVVARREKLMDLMD